MEVKSTGASKDFNKTMSYLGTETDNTPAHKNPGKTKYYQAKANGDTARMTYFKPYLKRDQLTFGNIGVNGIKQIEAENRKAIGSKRKVKSHEFILMPSKSDHIDPHDPDSLLRMKRYTQQFMGYAFQGKFVHPKGAKTKRGKPKYYFQRDDDDKPRFQWFADLQVDSHNHARPHVHIVVFNKNLKDNGKAMNAHYYGIHHLRDAVNGASDLTYTDDPSHVMSSATVHNGRHEPSKVEKKIIHAARNIRHNPGITSRPKLIKALAKNGVTAKYRRNKKHPERSGWKFKVPRHSYIKASNISHSNGGEFLASAKLEETLSDNRKLKAKIRQNAEIKARRKRLTDLARQQQRLAQRQHEAEIKREKHERKIKNEQKAKRERRRQRLQSARNKAHRKIKQKINEEQQIFTTDWTRGKRLSKEIQDGDKVLTLSAKQRHENDKLLKESAKEQQRSTRTREKLTGNSKRPVSRLKDRLFKRFGQLRKKITNWFGSIFKPKRPKHKAVKTSWRDYKQSSIQADKYVHNEAKEAIGKKPRKPTRQVQSSVATTPKSSTAKSAKSESRNLDKQILKRAKQLRAERGKDEPPLP